MALRSYLATEVALDHADGLLTRREALRRLGTLGLSAVAASGLLSACADAAPAPAAAPTPAAAAPDYDVAAATARTEAVTFPGGTGSMSGAFAAAQNPKGAVLVVHENRGLTDHIRAVTGRLAGDGYTALAPDLLSARAARRAVPTPPPRSAPSARPTSSPTCAAASPSWAAAPPGQAWAPSGSASAAAWCGSC